MPSLPLIYSPLTPHPLPLSPFRNPRPHRLPIPAAPLHQTSRAPGRPPVKKSAIKVTESNKTYLKFQLIGAETSYANALRRVMVAEVATLAMSEVTIQENTSPLFDEFIAHRLGLIPLHCQNLDAMKPHYVCQCNTKAGVTSKLTGCISCSRTFNLDVVNSTDSPLSVTTNDLQSDNTDTFPVHTDGHFDGYYKPITIAKLAPGQRLRLTCKARKSIGKEHAKHIPGHVTMYPLPRVILNKPILQTKLNSEERKAVAAVCPANTIVYKRDTDTIEVEDALTCIQCMECMKEVENKALDGIIIEEDDSVFYYVIESFGQFSPLDILTKGLAALQVKVSTITSEIVNVQRNSSSQEMSMFG